MQLYSLILSLPTFLSLLGGKVDLSTGFFLADGEHPLGSFSSFLVGRNFILIREFQQQFIFPAYAVFLGKSSHFP